MIIPTFGILQWTKEEIEEIDVKTCKILCLHGSFHVNSDVDRLYSHRNSGGRGLNNISDLYISRIISISRHLEEQANQNEFLSMVLDHEKEALVQVADQLINVLEIEITETSTPKELSEKSKIKIKKNHVDNWMKKPQHGFLTRTREQVTNIDDKYTNKWMKTSTFSSHVEGYICAVQEGEIFTRALEVKRKKDSTVNPNCRLYGRTKETIQHIIAS